MFLKFLGMGSQTVIGVPLLVLQHLFAYKLT
jgi:hypothetical protein